MSSVDAAQDEGLRQTVAEGLFNVAEFDHQAITRNVGRASDRRASRAWQEHSTPMQPSSAAPSPGPPYTTRVGGARLEQQASISARPAAASARPSTTPDIASRRPWRMTSRANLPRAGAERQAHAHLGGALRNREADQTVDADCCQQQRQRRRKLEDERCGTAAAPVDSSMICSIVRTVSTGRSGSISRTAAFTAEATAADEAVGADDDAHEGQHELCDTADRRSASGRRRATDGARRRPCRRRSPNRQD